MTGLLLALLLLALLCLCPPAVQVYAWFLGTYKCSVAVGMAGYFLLVLDMFGVGLLLARFVEPGGFQTCTLCVDGRDSFSRSSPGGEGGGGRWEGSPGGGKGGGRWDASGHTTGAV